MPFDLALDRFKINNNYLGKVKSIWAVRGFVPECNEDTQILILMKYTRKQISRAGLTMLSSKSQKEVEDAVTIINDWRSNHVFVLDQLKPFVSSLFEDNGIEPLFSSQRLKRMTSIQYKLDLNPNMGLGGMQDIGGLRFVLQDVSTLEKTFGLIKQYLPENFTIYKINDYVNERPKSSGYRSIHVVYQYSSRDERYDGLRVELQIRTKLQHNWATAVETAGLASNTSLKSSQGDNNWLLFFKVVSCLMSIKEHKPMMPEYEKHTMEKLMRMCFKMDKKYKYTDTLKALRVTVHTVEEKQYIDDLYLIIINFEETMVTITGYSTAERNDAIKQYAAEEETAIEGKKAVVLVAVDNIRNLKEAYPSYFLDTSEFITVLENIKRNCINRGWIE